MQDSIQRLSDNPRAAAQRKDMESNQSGDSKRMNDRYSPATPDPPSDNPLSQRAPADHELVSSTSSEYYSVSTTATSSITSDPNVFSRHPSRAASSFTATKSRANASFCYQLGITIKRMLLLTIREPVSFLCELLIPIVFVVGTVVLWAVFGSPSYDAATYFSTADLAAGAAFYTGIPSLMCVNSTLSDGVTIGTLPDCTTFGPITDDDTLLCADDKSGAPVGLCGTQKGGMLAYWGWKHVIKSKSTLVPTLDEIIPVKWMDRILYDETSVLSQILPNTDGSSIISFGKLLFAPDTQDTANLVNHLKSTSTYFSHLYGGTYTSADAANDLVYKRSAKEPPYWGIIVVNALNADSFDVEIKLNATALPPLRQVLRQFYVGGIQVDGSEMYLYSGFSTLQKAIYEYYMTKIVVVPTPPTKTVVLPAPTAAYKNQQFVAVGGQMAPMIIVLGFLYPVSQMTKRIVVEKELRLREAMLIMGLNESVMYVAWLIIYTVQYIFVSLVMALLMKVTYLKESNYGIIFFTLFFFCLSIISLSGLIASFFNQSRLSSLMAPLIFFVMSIPLFATDNVGGSGKAGMCILSPSALAVAFTTIFEHELEGGMNAAALTFFRDSPKMIFVMIMLLIDFVLYSILMLYFDAVLPREWGTTKHPLFFILDPIKCCCGKKEEQDTSAGPDGRAENGVFEPVTDADKSAIRIEGLRKVFHRGKDHFVAVNNFYWTMREGEISVLLGHNGAGKTTTMNMMTGMIEADAGDCYIYDKSVRYDLTGARHEIGYCPQHNILWPNLTCREHLWYYASVKGLRGEEREAAIEKMLIGVDLMDKAEYHSANLSGGQKRKLSVAVAFVGGSRLVFLDEPTAGMDVGARRHTWALLREMSLRHSILLTTHFMDEADLLGDTIAIMSKGSMQCCGSSLFLKSSLGVGYVLTMSVVAHVDRAPIASLVQKYVPGAEQLGSGAGEVAYRLPMEAKSSFPPLLREIEDGGSHLGVNAYSISATTLEEIFLQIAKAVEDAELAQHLDRSPNAEDQNQGHSDVWNVPLMHKESTIAWSQLKAMLRKRLWNSLRDRRTQFFQIVCPVMCVLLAMLLMLIKLFKYPNKLLNSNMYDADVEVDVVGCPAMNLAIPFSSRAITYSPAGVTTTEGLSDYMLDTYYKHATGKERYGGLTCDDPSGAAIFYNSSSLHEVGIGMYNLYNGYFMAAKGKDNILTTTAGSMRQTKTQEAVQNSVYTMMIAAVVMIPFTFIPSTFVSWIVKERQCKARHLQNVSGLFFSIYWLANYMFDTVSYIITMVLVIIVFLIFDRTEYVGRDSIGATFILLFLYGLSGIAMAYLVSFLFNDHSSAQNIVMLANFIAGFLLVLCMMILSIISSTEDVAHVLRWIFRIVPSYCVGEGISNLALLKMREAFGTDDTAFSMQVVGWPCVYMAIEIPFFVFGTLFIDHPGRRQRAQRLFHNPDAPAEEIENEDVDVIGERDAVLNSEERKNDLVSVEHLRKVYDNGKVAVRNITFGVKPGEVFGFLGTNGAGKTTTISILCQEFFPTSGHASVCGNDIVENSREALRCIGYCPQFDATIDLLTAEEHLQLYAGVRGIEYDARPKVVEGLLSLCELTSYRDTKAHEMSGGNRRKLSVAISLIGGPRVVFLDEPSAGMDPVARRGLWTAIETVADNCSVVLTTHHLEEVEALAHRVAIMVDGTLRCIGDKTHLKQKYGSGFEVNVRISTEDEAVKEGVTKFFAETFPGSELREYRAKRFTFELPGSTKLSNTFKVLEENVKRLQVTDYNVSQTSIEQVFLQISQEAENRGDD